MSNITLVEVTVTFYANGDTIDAPEDEHAVWLNPVEDTTEENPDFAAQKNGAPEAGEHQMPIHDSPKEWRFTEDNVGVDVHTIGDSPGLHYSCALDYDIEATGADDVFRPDLDAIIDIAKAIRQSLSQEDEKAAKDSLSMLPGLSMLSDADSPARSFVHNVVRFIGVWDYVVTGGGGYYGDEDYDAYGEFLGVLDVNSIKQGLSVSAPEQRAPDGKFKVGPGLAVYKLATEKSDAK